MGTKKKILSPHLTLLAEPKQDRSRETLKRLVAAVRELLDERDFDDISIADIARRGGSSVGAFYARFKDKDMFLDHLAGLYLADMAVWETERAGGADAPLGRIVRETIETVVQMQRRHRGALRAIVLRTMASRGSAQVERAARYAGPPATLVAEIRKRRGEINHPDPDTAVRLALAVVGGVVRERVLFPELGATGADAVPITDAVLVEELTRTVLGLLGVDDR